MNPEAFYAYARSKVKTKERISDLEDENGQLPTQDTGKADLLIKLFIANFMDRAISNTITVIFYKQKAIADILKRLTGPDGHHPVIPNEVVENIAEPLSITFNTYFNEGCLPEA